MTDNSIRGPRKLLPGPPPSHHYIDQFESHGGRPEFVALLRQNRDAYEKACRDKIAQNTKNLADYYATHPAPPPAKIYYGSSGLTTVMQGMAMGAIGILLFWLLF